jgi:hypothetical protein
MAKMMLRNIHIIGFLDCPVDDTCTPGTGSFTDEELAPREPGAEVVQKALYSGYLMWYGLNVFLQGKMTYALLNMSWMNQHSMGLQPEIPEWRANGKDVFLFS